MDTWNNFIWINFSDGLVEMFKKIHIGSMPYKLWNPVLYIYIISFRVPKT